MARNFNVYTFIWYNLPNCCFIFAVSMTNNLKQSHIMKTYTFTFGFMETVALENALRSSLSRLWELYCDAKRNHATTAMLNSLRLDMQDIISAIRKVNVR